MLPQTVMASYTALGISANAYSFFDRMDLVYGVTDLAVGRAGATFLAEITAKEIPAILIPYPYGNGHQRNNAAVFSKNHQAVVLEQSELTAEVLNDYLIKWIAEMNTPSRRKTAKKTNSRALLADFIEEMVAGK
jgi:UDP-N-acetylglucosamine--N-acetylmuramyl-(pentapeptide) pyrophosphoryl-undecaprenol N-acetylglucosamine transferase